jgi:hypothetical protein
MRILFLTALVLVLFTSGTAAQSFSTHSIKTGIGIGMNEGSKEMGFGPIMTIGYQKSLWKSRFRINPYMLNGGFWPFGITDIPDQYYRATSLGCNVYLDILRYHGASVFIGGGGFVNYSRGLIGTGGWPEEGNNRSEYLFKLYAGGYFGGGIRIDPPNRRLAWEITPFNFCIGNDYFLMSFLKIGVDVKLGKMIQNQNRP